ncbi:S1 family peptidase [Actinophytocola sediminis]
MTERRELTEHRGRPGNRGLTIAGLAAGMAVLATVLAPPAGAIIGGTEATEDYSFIVTLRNPNGVHYCGGALVAPDWVVTAGHCTHVPVDGLTVKVGGTDIEEGGSERGVAEIVTHPDYTADPDDLRHDIALLRLDEPVDHEPIGIAGDLGAPGSPVRALGWGMTCEDGAECPEPPATLRELDTEIVADERCTGIDAASDLCVEHPTEQAQSCVLDSGGPLLRYHGERWELTGVTSRDGDAETDPNCVGPGVWTDAAAYADWIRTTAGIEHANCGFVCRLLAVALR